MDVLEMIGIFAIDMDLELSRFEVSEDAGSSFD